MAELSGTGTARAAGPRPMFQLPAPCGETWRLSTYAGHDDYDIDMIPTSGSAWGRPILASFGGTVVRAGIDGTLGGRTPSNPSGPMGTGGGYYVRIDHGNGWESLYLHMLQSPMVRVGQQVRIGQQLGKVGSTGSSSGPHLHFEQTRDGAKVESYFNGVPSGITHDNYSYSVNRTSYNCGPVGSAAPALMRDDGDGTMTLWRWSSSGSSFSLEGDLFESGGWTMSRVGDRVAAGDVDGDGRDDVVATYQESDGSFSFRVWKGGVSHERWYSSGPFNLDPVGGRLVVGDWNGDGKAEPALMRDDGDGTMTIWRWLSSGSSFERASDYESGGWTMSRVGDRVAAGDVNGDGKDDIVATYQESDGSFSYRVWKGGLSHERWYSSGPFNLDPVGGRLVVGDFNGDGKAEPAMMRDDGDRTMTIWRWVSSGSSFERASDYESGGWTMSQVEDRVAAGDVNGDGKDDIVAAYQNAAGDFTYHVWKNAWTHGEWYTSGQYSLGPVDSRMILGRW
ncbi:FG-GAP-like repeat-containing protein [Micromonospora profundi]|uniref:FG-GAP-like repeat-containing protein n=1 Tax=Micromonospora profundi TaxID=1420889 RepID=UPI0036BCE507